MEAIFNSEEKLNATYQSVSVIYATNKATLLPKSFPESDLFVKIASLTNDISKSEDIGVSGLKGFNQQIIFSYPKEMLSLLNSKYTSFSFKHKSVPLLAAVVEQHTENKNTLLINFEKQYIRMIVLKDMQLELYNSFYFKNESDFLYYTLNICHTLHLNPESDDILIGGYVADDSNYIRQLKKYINNVYFLKPPADYYYGHVFDKVQKHQFVSLLNSHVCG